MGKVGPRGSHRGQGAGPGQVPCQMPRCPLPVILAEQAGLGRGHQLPLPSCPLTVASLTRAGTACVGPRLRQQVEKHIAQKSPQGKAEQLLQAAGPSYKTERQRCGPWGLTFQSPWPDLCPTQLTGPCVFPNTLQASRMLDLACCLSWIAPTAPGPALAGCSARNTSHLPDDCGTTTSWLRDRTPELDRSQLHNPPAGDPGQVTSGTQFPHL